MPVGDAQVPGMLDIAGVKSAVGDGSIDTVILAFPDLYGRLLGKRLDASFFLTDVAGGTHVCDYLFTVDMDMEPVAGYEFANWDRGYGDVHLVPDLATMRRLAWLDRTRAGYLRCAVAVRPPAGSGGSPFHPAQTAGAVSRERLSGHGRLRVGVLPVPRVLHRGR